MKYEELPEEMRVKLEASFDAWVREKSLVGESNQVDDAVLMKKSTEADVNAMPGYTSGHNVAVWFDFVSAPYAEQPEKCVELVQGALNSL